MEEIQQSKELVLCNCEDRICDILYRMNFLREIYGCVDVDFYDAFLMLIFEDMDKFASTLQKIIDEIEAVREKTHME